jgi:hypothetical protein
MSKDPFSYFRFGITDNAAIKGTVNSLYSLLMAIGVVGLLITLVIIGIRLMSPNSAKRAEAMEEMKWKVLIAVVLFGMTGIIGAVLAMAEAFI